MQCDLYAKLVQQEFKHLWKTFAKKFISPDNLNHYIIRSVNTWFPESVNIWRYALRRGSMTKSFFIALSVCKHFCFSSFDLSLTWFAVADPPFIILSLPPQFSVTAVPWNRLPKPWKAKEDSGNCPEGLPWPGCDETADISVLSKEKVEETAAAAAD